MNHERVCLLALVVFFAGVPLQSAQDKTDRNPAPRASSSNAASRALFRPAVLKVVRQFQDPVITIRSPNAQGNKYGFEGGRVLKQGDTYHLFTSEIVGEPFAVRMKLAHWTSKDRIHWQRVSTLFTSSGDFTGKDPRAALWAPMPVFDQTEDRWALFYVSYRSAPDSKTQFLRNHEGRIWRAVSTVKGQQGIDGPYRDAGIILQPGKDSDSWEGLQGVDSIFPYQVEKKWYAFYGSAHTQTIPISSWQVGLASAPALAGPWQRCSSMNPLKVEKIFMENPVVTKLRDHAYIAVYDTDINFPNAVGYTFSTDGIHWGRGQHLVIDSPKKPAWFSRTRTPLGLIPESNGEFTLFYTAFEQSASPTEFPVAAVGLVTLKLETPAP